MTAVYCNDPDCRFAGLDGICSAKTIKIDNDDGFSGCLTCDCDCGGLEGYQEPYWTRCINTKTSAPPEVKVMKLGRKIVFGAYAFYTNQKNPQSVTEERTGLIVPMLVAMRLHENEEMQKKLAEIPDVETLPTGEDDGGEE